MDFFESQDSARRNTKFLILLFVLAVLSLVVLSNLMLFALMNFSGGEAPGSGGYYYDLKLMAVVSVGVVVLITIASLIRMLSLRKGGSAVAEMLDGELLVDPGDDLRKQKLMNVVAEMAIASGTPVPPVYLIRDNAINAFAAGYSPGDAVIGVTYGAIENLSRDELQGVVAHEFSHILNGDMRMNIRIMGVLYGILVLTIIGRLLAHSGAYRSGSRSGGNNSDGRIAMVGLGLIVIGYIGYFFGSAIKSAVSRQREYLADASAVQFTRNPKGIADALKRIGGYSSGTVMQHPESEEISHAFFCEGISFGFMRMMATHPPLDQRISRLQPDWDGGYLEGPPPATAESALPGSAMGFAGGHIEVNADQIVQNIGQPGDSQVNMARQIISSLPDILITAARDPFSARALIYLMHLDTDAEVRGKQLTHLQEAADLGIYDALGKLIEAEDQLQPGMRLALIELALPTLRQLSYEQYKLFLANLDVLIRADNRVSLSEWARQKMIEKHLGEAFEGQHTRVRFNSLEAVQADIAIVMSILAYADRRAEIDPETAFATGKDGLGIDIALVDKQQLGFRRMTEALDNLAALHPLRKPKLLKACVRTIAADNVLSLVEEELLRTISDTLDCPMPPLSTT